MEHPSQPSSQTDPDFGRVGEEVIFRNKKWKIVADNCHGRPFKKYWDYILKDKNGKEVRIFKEQLPSRELS